VTVIHVVKSTITGGRASGRPYMQNHYACTGPDETKFTNSDKAELKRILTRRYGKVTLVIEDAS
jgi:hypothetical protein